VLKAAIGVRALNGRVRVMLRHLFRDKSNARDLVFWPHDLNKVGMQRGDESTQ